MHNSLKKKLSDDLQIPTPKDLKLFLSTSPIGDGPSKLWVSTWCAGCKSPLSLSAVNLGEDDLVIRIADLDVHADAGTGRSESISAGIEQLNFVMTCKKCDGSLNRKLNWNITSRPRKRKGKYLYICNHHA